MVKKVKVDIQVSELKEQVKRVLADYDNLVKRTEREREEIGKLVLFSIIKR